MVDPNRNRSVQPVQPKETNPFEDRNAASSAASGSTIMMPSSASSNKSKKRTKYGTASIDSFFTQGQGSIDQTAKFRVSKKAKVSSKSTCATPLPLTRGQQLDDVTLGTTLSQDRKRMRARVTLSDENASKVMGTLTDSTMPTFNSAATSTPPPSVNVFNESKLALTPINKPDHPTSNLNRMAARNEAIRQGNRKNNPNILTHYAWNVIANFEGDPLNAEDVKTLYYNLAKLFGFDDATQVDTRFTSFLPDLAKVLKGLADALLDYHLSTKDNPGNKTASAAKTPQKTYNAVVYEEIEALCPQNGTEMEFYAVKSGANPPVDKTLKVYTPQTYKNLPCFEVLAETIKNHFKASKNNQEKEDRQNEARTSVHKKKIVRGYTMGWRPKKQQDSSRWKLCIIKYGP